MIDHIGLSVASLGRSKSFYLRTLAPLGYELLVEEDDWAGFGTSGEPDFWIKASGATAPRVHVAFRAEDRGAVIAFHDEALSAGGTDNGPPGLRPHYHPLYYGAFVFDPDGHNIEAVCHEIEVTG